MCRRVPAWWPTATPLPSRPSAATRRARCSRPPRRRSALPSARSWGTGDRGVRPSGSDTVLRLLEPRPQTRMALIPLLLQPLGAALVHELVDLPQEIAVHDAEGVLELRGGPDGPFDHRGGLDGADAEPSLGGLAVLELEFRCDGHGDLHHLLLALDVATDGLGGELVLVFRLGQRIDHVLPLGNQVDCTAHVSEAPGELLLLHAFLDLGARPCLLQSALQVGTSLALHE